MRRPLFTLLLLVAATSALSAQDRQVVNVPGATSGLPFSSAVRTGNLLFLSGQIGTTATGLVPGGVRAEVRQTLENIRAVLDASGSSLSRVVKCTVFLADIADFAAMNEVYRTYFPEAPPARSTIAASGLVLGARVEIECIAAVG